MKGKIYQYFLGYLVVTAIAVSGNELLPVDQEPPIVMETHHRQLGITELTLRNGLKVVLKPTSFDKNEVFLRFLAPGGYATLDKCSRSSARVATRAIFESGLGGYSYDQLASLQYREFVDIKPQIDRFYRSINGSCRPESIATALKIIQMIFQNHEIKQSALKKVIESEKKNYIHCHPSGRVSLSELYYLVNTGNSGGFRSIGGRDLNDVNCTLVESILTHSFSRPSEFIGTIVGNIDVEESKRLVVEFLGALEDKKTYGWEQKVPPPTFPAGISRQEVAVGHSGDCEVTTWITLPINEELDANSFHAIQLTTRLVEARLQNVGAFINCPSECLDVFYDLPMFPYLKPVWINIRFRCTKEQISPMEQAIMKELTRLCCEGPRDEELATVKRRFAETTALWQRYNSFWHSNLINCYIWGWDPKELNPDDHLNTPAIRQLLKKSINLDNYSVINAYPD